MWLSWKWYSTHSQSFAFLRNWEICDDLRLQQLQLPQWLQDRCRAARRGEVAGHLRPTTRRAPGDFMVVLSPSTNRGFTMKKSGFFYGNTTGTSWGKWWCVYPLEKNVTVCDIENGHRNSWFAHWKWWFSIVMLVYRGTCTSNWLFQPYPPEKYEFVRLDHHPNYWK